MAKKKFNPYKIQRKLPAPVQNRHIKARFPQFSIHKSQGGVIWRGELQPRIFSPSYLIEIQYHIGRTPLIFVLSPPLVENAPHVYSDNSLCLYWPKEWAWFPKRIIATTIIPWIANWLYYYELWLDTGKWLGPSSHDNTPKQE